ncbi:hypothetical protein KY335_04895 [Candidatus Woesearchaeota archaeon]|nr:hypothetical protein [Candidatus Woesearchaeota archaeon]
MDLTSLGLTENEAKAFEMLVKVGKASASEIAKEAGISAGRIYDVLGSLEHKGLIKVIPEKAKKYVPNDPEELRKIVEKRRKDLDKIEKDIDELKKFYDIKEKEPVGIVRGKRNFYKLEREIPKPKKCEYNIKYTSDYKPVWEREYKEYLKKGIELKELVRLDEETAKNVKRWLGVHKNIKQIPNKGVAISIRDDSTIMIALIKSNTMMLIKDEAFVELMKELFMGYYQNANLIPK